ncbi:MAG TPA: DUF1444 family protein [Bacilli bacterium]|nr:DUF1444 family protein [Bacilli bacterium]
MRMNDFKDMLIGRLNEPNWLCTYDEKEKQLCVFHKEKKQGVTLKLEALFNKYKNKQETALEEAIYYVRTALEAMDKPLSLAGKEAKIYPIIRSTSFQTETKDGRKLLFDEHTAETRIYYALDLDDSFVLIDEELAEKDNFPLQKIREISRFNLRSLPQPLKKDVVAGNRFYFLHTNDGYDASRILDESLIEKMAKQAEGQLAVAVPHQDVLIFADLINENGYDVLAQVTFQFFGQGKTPITALPFMYDDSGLEPTFILARRKSKE